MPWKCLVAALVWLSTSAALAQPLTVYSEFRRVGPNGQIIRQDAAGDPREILSPAVLRGMRVTYRVVVKVPAGERYWMYVGSNPEELIQYKLYRERFTGGLPTALEEQKTPVTNIPTTENPVDSYLLDLFVPPTTPVRRMRFEAQLNFQNRWVIYPLEVRILQSEPLDESTAVPAPARPNASAAAATAAQAGLRDMLCADKPVTAAGPLANPAMPTQVALLARNAQQDWVLMQAAEKRRGKAAVMDGMAAALGAADVKAGCTTAARPLENADSILRARDFLIRAASDAE